MERLQKVMSERGFCSRRKAEKLIVDGKVRVNGEVVTTLGVKVGKKDSIVVDGVALDNDINYEYYLLYKPRGVVTTTSDDKGRKTVVSLIDTNTRIYPVGRLDYDTTGLLILTNDGELANKLMHPSNEIEKVYIAKVEGVLSGYEIKKLRTGVMIDGYKTKKARVKLLKTNRDKDTCLVEITIHEGHNRQIRKMIESLGKKVIKLKRERYAFLNLDGLKVGKYRKLSNKEVSVLYSLVK
ncbi:MAG: pseudouridine synthase [Bacilli bacterium]|nr:pseudouridine synthase [Bacilli bacterium]